MPTDREQRVAFHREVWLQRFAKAFEKEHSEQTTQTSLANTDEPIQEDGFGNSITPHSHLSPQSPLLVSADTPINSPLLPSASTIESLKGQDLAISGASSYCDSSAATAAVSDVNRTSISG
jgi:hypothetical protein